MVFAGHQADHYVIPNVILCPTIPIPYSLFPILFPTIQSFATKRKYRTLRL